MQTLDIEPLIITIPGQYYDSQIYDGRLYLWKIDGSILTLDWNLLIGNITVDEDLSVVLKFALLHGDNLYENLLLKDKNIESIIKEKFQKLAKISIEIPNSDLDKITVGNQNNLLPFPHADSAIHYKTVYVGSQSGVSSSECIYSSRTKSSINTKIKKLCDLPVVSISASNRMLALAAGSEGLFDYYLKQNSSGKSPKPRNIDKEHSNFTRWLYPSIFSSSYLHPGRFADFKLSKVRKSQTENNKQQQETSSQLSLPLEEVRVKNVSSIERDGKRIIKREFKTLFSANEIFENIDNEEPLYTWGTYDKICLVKENSIELVKYLPSAKSKTNKFRPLGFVNNQELSGDIISADSSFFGIVLEKEDGLLIITSLLKNMILPGEPVNWRVFPKSRNYINQLHVIYEDNLKIYSFNHDFFVKQEDKKIGMSFGAGN